MNSRSFCYRRLLLLLLMTGCLSYAQAQVYYPAKLVLRTGETLSGEAAIRSFDQSSRKVQYRSAPGQATRTYSALEVDRLIIAGRPYRGGVVQLERSPYRHEELRQQAEWQYTQDTLFLETVLTGDRSLYRVGMIGAQDLYYIPNDAGGYELLRYKRYLKTSPKELSTVRERRDFVLQLSNYLTDCPGVRAGLQGIAYEEAALKRLFNAHARCTNTEITTVSRVTGGKAKVRLIAGVSSSRLTVLTGSTATRSAYRGTALARPTAGLGIDYIPKQGRSNWMLSGEFVYTGVGQQPTRLGSQTSNLDPFSIGYFEAILSGRSRRAINEHTYLLTGLGIVIGQRVHADVRGLSYTFVDDQGFTRTQVLDSNENEFGGVLQLGIQYKPIQVQAFLALLSPNLATGRTLRIGLAASYYIGG